MRTTALKVRARGPRGLRGFTLGEVLIATTLSAIIMAAILSSFLMMGRSGANAANYVTMERQARIGLERFGEDARMAKSLTTVSSSQIKFVIPHSADNGTDEVYYTYSSANKTFSRLGPDPVTGTANTTTVLIQDVQNCEFKKWLLGTIGPATGDANTDQIQIRLTVQKTSITAVKTTNLVVSARYMLRNHKNNTT
jgi:Tfp pilus assembly protein PilW